ncbi:hypothetical protein Nepgr_024482 [Nepenthes gracilis]|uniref:Uncharacterized protein n=1 Tax=Nepenthes gracilis TaxID=150966 RepID=A0AAD3T5A1_NEPGR|nr:hypothetical protein Nepgr_024482 [Nepenthes gracilis]
MDMTLDDIIKMSKSKTAKSKNQRASNKSRKFFNGAQGKQLRMRQYMDSRSALRQGVLAQRRSNFQGNRFPIASEAARRAAVAPLRNRAFIRGKTTNWNNKPRAVAPLSQKGFAPAANTTKQMPQLQMTKPKTLDSLFANMKEQRTRSTSHPNYGRHRGGGAANQRRLPWGRGQFANN